MQSTPEVNLQKTAAFWIAKLAEQKGAAAEAPAAAAAAPAPPEPAVFGAMPGQAGNLVRGGSLYHPSSFFVSFFLPIASLLGHRPPKSGRLTPNSPFFAYFLVSDFVRGRSLCHPSSQRQHWHGPRPSHDFPTIPGKSGCVAHPPPKFCAGLTSTPEKAESQRAPCQVPDGAVTAGATASALIDQLKLSELRKRLLVRRARREVTGVFI